MDYYVNQFLNGLFQLAERVVGKAIPKAPAPEPPASTIRFSDEDKMVEGDLFK